MPRKPGRPQTSRKKGEACSAFPATEVPRGAGRHSCSDCGGRGIAEDPVRAPAALSTIELARSIRELTDRSIGQVHAACHDGHRVACRSGCTYCCMVPVAASAPEVLAIAAFVRERFDEERQSGARRPRRGQHLGDRGHGHEPEGSRQAGLPLPRGGPVLGLRGQADRMPGSIHRTASRIAGRTTSIREPGSKCIPTASGSLSSGRSARDWPSRASRPRWSIASSNWSGPTRSPRRIRRWPRPGEAVPKHSKPRPGRAFFPAHGRTSSTRSSRRCTGRRSRISKG